MALIKPSSRRPALVSTPEAAKALGVSSACLDRRMKILGEAPARKFGKGGKRWWTAEQVERCRAFQPRPRGGRRAGAGRKRPASERKPALRADSDWRCRLYGSKGWFVVRCGTRESMEAWARLYVNNGFSAEAVQNKHGSPGEGREEEE